MWTYFIPSTTGFRGGQAPTPHPHATPPPPPPPPSPPPPPFPPRKTGRKGGERPEIWVFWAALRPKTPKFPEYSPSPIWGKGRGDGGVRPSAQLRGAMLGRGIIWGGRGGA